MRKKKEQYVKDKIMLLDEVHDLKYIINNFDNLNVSERIAIQLKEAFEIMIEQRIEMCQYWQYITKDFKNGR